MNLNRTIINYLLLAAFALIINKIYGIFGHGITSPWMSNMYLYLLGLGAVIFFLIRIRIPNIVSRKGYRLFFNVYNSGIAVLINGMLLYGIIDVAGGSSRIAPLFIYTGSGLLATACFLFFRAVRGKSPTVQMMQYAANRR